MMYDRALFSVYRELTQKVPVRLGHDNAVCAVGIGTAKVNTVYDSKVHVFSLPNVYHMPDFDK